MPGGWRMNLPGPECETDVRRLGHDENDQTDQSL